MTVTTGDPRGSARVRRDSRRRDSCGCRFGVLAVVVVVGGVMCIRRVVVQYRKLSSRLKVRISELFARAIVVEPREIRVTRDLAGEWSGGGHGAVFACTRTTVTGDPHTRLPFNRVLASLLQACTSIRTLRTRLPSASS